jgi:hypothetical protein
MNTKRNISRKLAALVAAAAFSAPVLSLTSSTKALTYVNLNDEPVAIAPGNRPVTTTTAPEPLAEPMPEDPATMLRQFEAYRNQVLATRGAAQATMQQQVAALDSQIHQHHVAREMARSNWYALRTQDAADRFWAAQRGIESLQHQRFNLVGGFHTGNIAMLNDLAQRDPNAQANVAWYNHWITQNNALYGQELAKAQATFGIPQ